MISSVSIQGMRIAASNFHQSAQKIVSAGIADSDNSTEKPEIPVTSVNGISAVGSTSTAFAASEDIHIEEMTNMMVAEQAYKANIAAYKTSLEMAEELDSLIKK